MLGPSLHTLQSQAKLKGFDQIYIDRLLIAARRMQDCEVPTIFSLMHLAVLSHTSWTALHNAVQRSGSDYRVFFIDKRSGGKRRICIPPPSVKKTQHWIHTNILCSRGALKLLSPASQAYSPKSSIKKNANQHVGCEWIVKIDIKDFFESISERQVYYVFRRLGYGALISFELAKLCTRVIPPREDGVARPRDGKWRWENSRTPPNAPYVSKQVGHLPQGAPTSAMLANYVAIDLDEKLSAIAENFGASYTRYADDMVLSLTESSRAQCYEIFRQVSSVVTHAGFRLNRKKSFVSGPGARKIVTGLVINDSVPRLKKSVKNEIELALYHIEKRGLLQHVEHRHSKSPISYLNHLFGLIYFAHSIEEVFGAKSLIKLKELLLPYEEILNVLRDVTHQKVRTYTYA